MSFCGWFLPPLPCLPGKFQATKSSKKKNALEVAGDQDDTSSTKSEESALLVANAASSHSSPSWDEEMSPAQVIPLNDNPSCIKRMSHENTMTLRRDPKMRLVTSTSTLSLSDYSHHSEESDWSMSGFPNEPTQVFDVGLMISIENGQCQFDLVPDANYPEIHPHVYAPANITDMRVLYGGGSGVAVFGGHSPNLGDIVMKHGGYKDALELFALATISEELKRRGKKLGHISAANNMQERLPSFKMIYMSPYHIMERTQELVGILKSFVRNWSLTTVPSTNSIPADLELSKVAKFIQHKQPQLDVGMRIRIFEGEEQDSTSFVVDTKSNLQSLSIVLPAGSSDYLTTKCIRIRGRAYESLKSVVQGLTPIMTSRMFKFTLAQKTIGGTHPKTGNQWLYEGKLSGAILKNLMDQMILVIRDLQRLTLPDEVNAISLIRKEVERFEKDEGGLRANDISDTADAFVGNAIKKNFHPEKGRQRFLREICAQFREESLILIPEEELPAKHLGMLLRSGALMSDTFLNTPMEPTVLQLHPHFWRNILRRAVESRNGMSKTALRRIWTCGLTDAGIHNLFVSETELYLFDLGEPQLMSLPGFLTKFLFSFFHTLGMEDDGNGTWVRRFVVVGDKLALTNKTLELLPRAYSAFEECLDRIIDELLDGDRHMRWLLLEYITMQLLSDTAFCLQKWRVKGGGKKREGNHQHHQEKWLWRALWDIYVAFDINTADSWYRFDVVHPHFRDSLRSSTMESFSDSCSVGTMKSLMASMRASGQLDESLLDLMREDLSDEEEEDEGETLHNLDKSTASTAS